MATSSAIARGEQGVTSPSPVFHPIHFAQSAIAKTLAQNVSILSVSQRKIVFDIESLFSTWIRFYTLLQTKTRTEFGQNSTWG
jgi:hypothetical protein